MNVENYKIHRQVALNLLDLENMFSWLYETQMDILKTNENGEVTQCKNKCKYDSILYFTTIFSPWFKSVTIHLLIHLNNDHDLKL